MKKKSNQMNLNFGKGVVEIKPKQTHVPEMISNSKVDTTLLRKIAAAKEGLEKSKNRRILELSKHLVT